MFTGVSGKPNNKGEFDYSKGNQMRPDVGPIPEGGYWAFPNDVQSFADQSIKSKLGSKSPFGIGGFPGGKTAWGDKRIFLYPKSISVQNPSTGKDVQRGNFSIHGGSYPGSRGCIDLTNDASAFFDMLSASSSEAVRLRVIYKTGK